MQPRYTAVFDLDGTLLDSAPDIIASLERALVRVGVEFTKPIPHTIVGPPILGMLERLGVSATDEQQRKVVDYFRRYYDACEPRFTKPYTGAVELLTTLKQQGWGIFLATNKPTLPTMRLVDRYFPGLIDECCCIDSGIKGQTLSKLEMFKYFRAKYNLAMSRTYMIGDSVTDIQAGQELGWYTIAVSWGYGEEIELRSTIPTDWAESMQDIFTSCMEIVIGEKASMGTYNKLEPFKEENLPMKFIKIKREEADVIQWFKVGDHPKVIRCRADRTTTPCNCCGMNMWDHGVYNDNFMIQMVCPGDYILTHKDGHVDIMDEEMLNKTYERASSTEDLIFSWKYKE